MACGAPVTPGKYGPVFATWTTPPVSFPLVKPISSMVREPKPVPVLIPRERTPSGVLAAKVAVRTPLTRICTISPAVQPELSVPNALEVLWLTTSWVAPKKAFPVPIAAPSRLPAAPKATRSGSGTCVG
jgi:hypothetical protein